MEMIRADILRALANGEARALPHFNLCDLAQELLSAREEITALHTRLEDNFAFKDGELIAVAPGSIPDGISCRNDTIRLQDERIAAARQEIAELRAVLKAALPRLAHRPGCGKVRPSDEWREHGSMNFSGCKCEIAQVTRALKGK